MDGEFILCYKPNKMKAFISYSHRDRDLLTELHSHLASLRRQDLLITWTDRQIPAGGIIDDHISEELEDADLYLLLISSAFIESHYCFEREFSKALERHAAEKAKIVPIILRDCDWNIPELRQFKALPEDGRAVTGRAWINTDEAFANVAEGLRKLLTSPSRRPKKSGKKTGPSKFVPSESHITSDQRDELRKIGEEVVERQTVNTIKMSDKEAQTILARRFGSLWKAFNEKFGTEHGLKSLPKEHFADAKSWLQQYRASNDNKLKTANPQKYLNSILKGIFGMAKELGWPEEQIYSFASEKLKIPVESLTADLRNDQLKFVRDRIRYEITKKEREEAKKSAKPSS